MPDPEYILLYFFCAGVLLQSLWHLSTRRQAAWAGILAIACAAPAWLVPGPEERSFASPLCWALFYSLVFSIVFRKRMLPAVTALIVLLYTALLYYVLYLLIADSGVEMPRPVIAGGLIPGILIIMAALTGLLKYKPVRVLCYLWYTAALCIMICGQWSLENLAELYAGRGFPPDLFIYVFLGGGVFLFFISNLVQLFLAVPFPGRASHSLIFEALFGPITYDKEQSWLMARRLWEPHISARGWALFGAYLCFLALNAKMHLIAHGLVINLSILAIYYFVMPHDRAVLEEAASPESHNLKQS